MKKTHVYICVLRCGGTPVTYLYHDNGAVTCLRKPQNVFFRIKRGVRFEGLPAAAYFDGKMWHYVHECTGVQMCQRPRLLEEEEIDLLRALVAGAVRERHFEERVERLALYIKNFTQPTASREPLKGQ